MTDGLKDEHREAIVAAIAANDRVERAVLFGSRATGTNTVSSDVDIALFGDRLTPTDQARLAVVLDKLPMAQSVDLLLYDSTLDRTLREQIRRQGVEFYVRPSPRPTGHRTRAATSIGTAVMPNGVETVFGWRRRDVGELIRDGSLTVGDGYRAKNSELAGSGLPFARAGNVADGFRFSDADRFPEDRLHRAGDKTSRPGDVVFTSKGTVGRFAFVRRDTEHFVYSPQLCFWRSLDREVIDPYFLYCWVRGPEFFGQFRGVAGQTDMAEYVSLTDQRRMFITLPPVAEQRTIAHILGTLDDKIELNRGMNATLEAMARALFKSWFVDFDPVRAKMNGRDTGLPMEIADLFPDRLTDSGMGEIPNGWTVGALGDIAAAPRRGIDPARVSIDTPFIGLQHMPRKSVALKDWGTSAGVSSSKFAFDIRDILFGKLRPYFHKVGIAPVNGLCSTDIVVLKARMPMWSAFVLACVSSSRFVSYASQTSTGTKMPRTSWDTMSRYELCRPTDAIAAAFHQVVSPMLERIVSNVHESHSLDRLRDALLSKLVSGELRVNGVEAGTDSRPAVAGTHES